MNQRETYIAETISILKERYNLGLSELIDVYSGETTIPATIYNNELTPLEATTQYLKDIRQYTTKHIAEVLKRRKSTIDSAYENAQTKQVQVLDDPKTPHRIPLTAFNKILSPSESIIYELHTQGNKNSEIAEILGKDARNIWQTLDRAKQKRGESNE